MSKYINNGVLLLLSALFLPLMFLRGNQFTARWLDLTDVFVYGSFLVLVPWVLYKILLSLGKGANRKASLLFLSAVTLLCLLFYLAALHGIEEGQKTEELSMYFYLIFTIIALSMTAPHDIYLVSLVRFTAFCAFIYVFAALYFSYKFPYYRFTGLTYAANEGAKNFFLIGLFMLWAMILYTKSRFFRLLLGLALLISVYLLVLAGSKTSLVAIFVWYVSIVILTSPFYKKTVYVVGGALFALSFILFGYMYIQKYAHIIEARLNTGTREEIIKYFLNSLNIKTVLVGNGLGAWVPFGYPHSFVIDFLFDFGFIVGGIMIIFTLALLIVPMRSFCRWKKRGIVDDKSFLNSVFLFSLSLVPLIFSGFTGEIFRNVQFIFFFGIYIAYWLYTRTRIGRSYIVSYQPR